jgi:NADH:ubiquinone oxidoreductase subunit F (NADH-binding)
VSAPPLTYAEPHAATAAPAGLPRLLEGIDGRRAMSLERHEALHGPLPRVRHRRGAPALDLIDELDHAGLRGRGGGGFPTAVKLRAVAASRGRAVVLVNAGEGEPASRKDRTLTTGLPHLVLDGGELAAQTLGARELILGVCESARVSADSLAMAIAERGTRPRGTPRARLVPIPDRYVASQETALVSHVSGGAALPTFTPPRPSERGVAGRPTLVANAETLAHVALIARHGAGWFRELGSDAEPGSALVTLTGPLARPGVYEIVLGCTLASLLNAAGGLTANATGVLLGGYSGCWVGAGELERLRLSDDALAPYGGSFGAGVVLVLSEQTCPVAEVTRLARWLAAQSAGQCGPCVHGLDAIARCLEAVVRGHTHTGGRDELARLTTLVRGRGACAHPDGAARMVASALDAFAPELDRHAAHGPCERCRAASELPFTRR